MIQKEQEEAIPNITTAGKIMIIDMTHHQDIIEREVPEMIHMIDHMAFTEEARNMKKDIDENFI